MTRARADRGGEGEPTDYQTARAWLGPPLSRPREAEEPRTSQQSGQTVSSRALRSGR